MRRVRIIKKGVFSGAKLRKKDLNQVLQKIGGGHMPAADMWGFY